MRHRRATLLVLEIAAALAVVLVAAWLLFTHKVYEAPAELPSAAQAPAAAPAAAPAPASEEAVVEAVVGSVQKSAPNGAWTRLTKGEHLRADDSLRTDKGARTDLRIGDKSHLTVAETSQLTIREITEKVHRFKLSRGRIAVDYKPDGGRVLRVENEGSDAVAETRGARFSVLSTGTAVAIATETGTVSLKARDQTVEVAQGTQALASAGRAPAAPVPLPIKLLLKVANAAQPGTAGLCANVEGLAPAGAEVLVDGEPTPVSEDGRFSVRVLRKPADKKAVLVATRDVSGHSETRSVPCIEDAARINDFAIHWRKRSD